MKKSALFVLMSFLFFGSLETMAAPVAKSKTLKEDQAVENGFTIYPLPDTTMENLSDAILAISLEEDGIYVDDDGQLQMDVKIYSYDKYDMVDIAMMKEGDILVTNAGEVELVSIEREENGLIFINGGIYENGFELFTDESGIYFDHGMSDAKNWYEVGESTIPVSEDFKCFDNSVLEQEEVIYTAESFLNNEIEHYYFSPHNTTIRIEKDQVVEMHRVYVP